MKQKLLLIIIFISGGILSANPAFCQATNSDDTPIYRPALPLINDLVHTKLDVRFDYQRSYLYGKAWITLKPHFYATDSLRLDAKGMDLKKIAIVVAGKLVPLRFKYEDSLSINIKLDKKYSNAERYTVYIEYTAKPNELHDKPGFKLDGKGLYFVNPLGKEADKPTQIWTQGEAESSSCWFPTIDKPNQKTTQELSMTVQAKYTTLSNGLLVAQKNNADGTRTDTWRQKLPHSPYLFMMAVGDFKIYKDKWRNKEVNYYLEPKYAPYSKQLFGQTPEMMEFFSKTLGVDFPWEKYSQVVVRDYPLGAMENSSATLLGDYVQKTPWDLIDDPNGAGYSTIAHELFHQWFGDLVTCETWSNETLNESFAVFGEKYWMEKKYGKDDGDAKRFDELQAYLNNKTASSQNLVPFYYSNNEGINGANIYDKGGIVLNMLRDYLGDEAFFKGLTVYLKTHAFKAAEVHDLRLAMEQVSGRDLNWYFNQWYYGAGHPVLDISYKWDAKAGTETVYIAQKQQGQIFRLPVSVDVYAAGKTVRHDTWLTKLNDTLTFKLPAEPQLVNVDAKKILLLKKTDHKTIDQFSFQFFKAPLYLDRLEAFNAASEQQNEAGRKIILAALKDKYYGLRIKAIRSLKTEDETLFKAATPILVDLANHDANNLVRSAAIITLGKTKSKEYAAIYRSALTSPSYSVKGAALNALNTTDQAEAFSKAKSMETDNKGKLGQAIVNVYAASGTDNDWKFVFDAFTTASPQGKVDMIRGSFPQMIGRLQNPQSATEGIHAIRDFGVSFKRYNLGSLIIPALKEIESARKKLNDDESAKAAHEATEQIDNAKS